MNITEEECRKLARIAYEEKGRLQLQGLVNVLKFILVAGTALGILLFVFGSIF